MSTYSPADLKWPDGRPFDATERLAWEAGWEACAQDATERQRKGCLVRPGDERYDVDAAPTKFGPPCEVPSNVQRAVSHPTPPAGGA